MNDYGAKQQLIEKLDDWYADWVDFHKLPKKSVDDLIVQDFLTDKQAKALKAILDLYEIIEVDDGHDNLTVQSVNNQISHIMKANGFSELDLRGDVWCWEKTVIKSKYHNEVSIRISVLDEHLGITCLNDLQLESLFTIGVYQGDQPVMDQGYAWDWKNFIEEYGETSE